ncbi:TPA: D-serine transporter DsdX, partial [Klebsiella pneumoniae]|nr:D-serine transporter DsdX [Klebsiella pneumoniae]HBY5135812.1 D-serine transporter DsdX [Klebsiella pneumoniae]
MAHLKGYLYRLSAHAEFLFNNHTLLTARWGMESQIWVVSTLLISIVLIV